MFFVGLLCLSLPAAAYKTPPPPVSSQTPTTPFFSIEGFPHVPRCGYKSCHSTISCNKEPPTGPLAVSRTPCFCDRSCVLFGDCCYDYYEVCLNSSMTQVEGLALKETILQKHRLLLRNRICMELGDQNFYWVVARCPQDSNESENVENCEQGNNTVFGRIPVTLKENPVITFANIHCAMCHGVNNHQVRFWKAKASYNGINTTSMSFQSIRTYVMTSKLTITKNPDDRPRPCLHHSNPVPSVIAQPINGSSTKDKEPRPHALCLMYSYPVIDSDLFTYKNPHCALNIFKFEFFFRPLLCPVMLGSAFFTTSRPSGGGFQGTTKHLVPTPFQSGYTPYPMGFTPYPGPNKYPIGYTPSPGATPYLGPTPYPIGFTPYPGATPYPGPTKYASYGKFVSLDILFNFGENEMSFQVGEQKFTDVTYCLEDEVYVTYSGKCEKLICNDRDTKPVNGSCWLLDKLIMNGTQQIFPQGNNIFVTDILVGGRKQKTTERLIKNLFGKSLLHTISSDYRIIDVQSFEKNCELDTSNDFFCNETSYESLLFKHQMNHNRFCSLFCEYRLIFEANIDSTNFINITFNAYQVFSAKMKHLKMIIVDFFVSNYQLNNQKKEIQSYVETMENVSCPVGTTPELRLGTDLVVANDIYFAKLGREYFRLDNVIFQISLKLSMSISKLADIILCNTTENNSTLHCSNGLVPIPSSTFKLGPDNDTLILLNGDGMLQSDNFTLTDEGAFVCNFFTSAIPQVRFFDYNQIQVILTIISSCTSIFSLLILLIVYLSLPELRNVPGKIVICLSSTLLLAQTLQLVNKVPTGWMCVVVASLSHVTWLSTFLWTTILSVDLARSLRSMAPIPGSYNHNKLLCLYSVIAWVLPGLFVMTNVLVDHFKVFGIVIGYGSGGLCWITNAMASLYVFGIPVVLTLVVNMFCFTLIVFGIERTAKLMMNRSKTCKNERTRLGIYIRLTFIMGFTWISCFAAAFVRVSLIWYLQIVLNGLQGFYIFLCFVCKSRIMRLLAEKYNLQLFKEQARDNPSITMTTST